MGGGGFSITGRGLSSFGYLGLGLQLTRDTGSSSIWYVYIYIYTPSNQIFWKVLLVLGKRHCSEGSSGTCGHYPVPQSLCRDVMTAHNLSGGASSTNAS